MTKIVNGKVVSARAIHPDAYEHVARAQLFEEEERWQEAIAELERALQVDRDAPELHARIAELELELGREDRAAAAVAESLELGETTVGLIALAHLRQRRHDAKGAVAALERATELASFADSADLALTAYLELADVKLESLDIEGARATLRELVREAPTATVARVRLAAVAWSRGDLAEVETMLRQALVSEPNHIEALLTLAWLDTASGKLEAARAKFTEALERAENALDVATAFARFLLVARRPAEAGQLCEDLSASGDDETLFERIELCRAAHRNDRALALAEQRRGASDLGAEVASRLDLVMADLVADKDRARALRLLVNVPRTAAAYPSARLRAAELYREAGQLADARRVLDELAPTAATPAIADEIVLAAVAVEEKQGAIAAAEARLTAALKQRPRSARLRLGQASFLDRQGRFAEALAAAEALLHDEPGNAEALNFWGFIAAERRHDLPRATRRIEAALAFDPGSGAILDSLGWAHLQAGKLAEANLFLQQAARLEPEDPEILSHVSELQERQGETERAIASLRKALGHAPAPALRKSIEQKLQRLERVPPDKGKPR